MTTTPMIGPLFLFAALLLVGDSPAAAQQTPSPQLLAQSTHELVQKLARLSEIEDPSFAQKAKLEAAQKELADLVATMAKGEGMTEDHFVQASSPLIETHTREALAISEAGVKRFPESRFLHDHTGFANTALAFRMQPSAARLTALLAAETAFRKALTCKPETFHAHMGLYQVLDPLGKCNEALVELEIAVKDPTAAEALNLLWSRRASLLMRSGKPKDALKYLQGVEVPDDESVMKLRSVVRANALAGDATATQAAIKAMRDAEASPSTLIEAADALAYLGKKAEALKLLAERPPKGPFKTEEEREAQLYSQSGAAMEEFLKATDYSHTGPLRAALTKALGHSYGFYDSGKQIDLSSSPVMMSKLLADMPLFDQKIKDWGNHLLFVLSVRAAPAHKPGPDEQKMLGLLKGQPMPTADDIAARLLALRYNVGEPDAVGVLMGLRAAEKLEVKAAPASAPAKK
ncbi:MAG TPA: hypothetical protein VF384_20140 [Planctomycetota bacterium]